ncbi:hypothetical protein M413DRAFT_32399 [Hebeloma cylindrosporum]|uniref:Aminoglycoside phosphotransferase domain-containing protein n=1 Tax=Hebeloma cylindrosporum TaxID=76867 RepID=A0A0C2Y3K6_HEBCY|nr:hypothetical protein M413DRAFT_32399 [Hebeloma cylindrosporum h7]
MECTRSLQPAATPSPSYVSRTLINHDDNANEKDRIFAALLASSIEIPNVIGSVMGVSEEGIPTVGPFEEEAVFRGSGRRFQSAMEYIEWRISASIWEDKKEASVDVPALLEQLEILARHIITRLDSSLLRACLVHVDPHDRNVMVEGSNFSGLVDWQTLALPAFMAAEYPPYLRYDGMYEDRYAALNQYGKIEFMNEGLRPSRDDAKILRDLYLELGKCTGSVYPHGSRVGVPAGMGTGMDSPTRDLQNEPKNMFFGHRDTRGLPMQLPSSSSLENETQSTRRL